MISYPAEDVGGAPDGPAGHGAWAEDLPMPRQQDYEALARFRYEIRSFLSFSRDVLDANGIPQVQHQAMLAIRARGDSEVTIGDLAGELQITMQSAVELIARMQDAGLIERTRSERDRRRVLVTLTPRANEVLPKMAALHLREARRRAPAFAAALANFLASAGDPAWLTGLL